VGGLRNILYAVSLLHAQGAGVNIKVVVDFILDVGPGKTTQFLCTECNPHGGQSGRRLGEAQSVNERDGLMERFRM
jgi:hypothetical protein